MIKIPKMEMFVKQMRLDDFVQIEANQNTFAVRPFTPNEPR